MNTPLIDALLQRWRARLDRRDSSDATAAADSARDEFMLPHLLAPEDRTPAAVRRRSSAVQTR